jgi:hypothetical protein
MFENSDLREQMKRLNEHLNEILSEKNHGIEITKSQPTLQVQGKQQDMYLPLIGVKGSRP